MKKITFLLTLLLTLLIGQEVQATSTYFVAGRTASITTGKQYMIYNTARRYFLSANGSGYSVTGNTTPLAYTTTSANYVWTLEEGTTSGTFKIKNVGTSTYAAGGTSLGSAIDYTVAEYSTCPSKGGMASYNDDGTTKAAASITSSDRAVYIKAESGSNPYWNGSSDAFASTGAAHVYVLYEVVEIAEGGLYTIDFVSQDGTKTWGLSTSGTSASATLNTTGSTFVAHSYTTSSSKTRWIFVNNTDGYYLSYKGATESFNTLHPINIWDVASLASSSSSNITGGDRTGKMYITNDKRFTNNENKGCYILKESTAGFDNSNAPYWNGTFTSALSITPVAGDQSSAASSAIANFDNWINNVADNLSDLSNSYCYNIINNRGWWAVGSGASDVNSTVELNLATMTSDTKQQFAFIYFDAADDSNDGYYLYSVGESKFVYKNGTKLSLTDMAEESPAPSKITFTASTNTTYNSLAPIIVTVDEQHFGVSTGQSPDVFGYTGLDDGGNAAAVSKAGDFNATTALAALRSYFNHTITYIVKDGEDNELFNSGAVDVPVGTSVSSFPTEYKRDYFYTYGDITPVTITDESDSNTDIVVVATAKDNVLEYTANTTSPVYYNLNIRGKYLVSAVGSTPDVSLSDNSTPFNKVAAWAFIGNPYDGFKIINQQAGTDKFLTYTSVVTGGNSGNNNIQFVDKEDFTNQYWIIEANNGGFCLRMKENMNIYFHHQNVTGQSGYLRTCSVSEWSTVHNDAGSTLTFSSDEQVLVDLYNEMQYIYFGDKYGQYTNGMTGDLADDAIANSTIRSAGGMIAAQATATYEDLYNLLIYIQNNIKDGYSTLNTPSAGFYRLKNKATGKYLRGKTLTSWDTGTKAVFADGNNSEAATVIRLYEKDGDEKLYMYNQSYGFGWVSTATGGGVAWLTENPNKYVQWYHGNNASPAGDGELAFAICYGNGTGDYASHKYKGFYTADTDDDAVIAGEDFTVNAAQWEVEAATSVTVALHNGGDGKSYATFYAPFDVTFTGATAYTITRGASIEDVGCEAVTTAVENNFVPAGTPVVLINEDTPSPATSCTATIEGTVSDALSTANILSGTYLAMTVEDSEDLVFGKPADGDPGFYRFDPEALSKVLGANKAYIDRTVAAGIRAFVFDSVTTGLNKVNLDAAKENIYDMQGRRVAKVQNGLYIVNGKKVLVK